MKVVKKEYKHYDTPVPVYDVINARPYNNFVLSNGVVAHNCALMDELEFMRGSNANYLESGVMKLYRGVKARMKSRFLKSGGGLPGMLFLVSSKKSEHDFLEQYIRRNITPSTMVVDEPQWVVRGMDKYCGDMFKVAVGSKFIKSKILGASDNEKDLEKQGYDIIEVPIEYLEDFKLNIDGALMDLAGIAVSATNKFMDADRVRECYSDRKNPFGVEVLTVGLDDDERYQDYFDMDKIDPKDKTRPGFIHLDASLTGDKSGISYVTISGRSKVRRYTKEAQKNTDHYNHVIDAQDLTYRQVFTVGIQAPVDSEISFAKHREFIYWLKSQGFNIKGISSDSFQSRDNAQILKQAGYNSSIKSLDRSPDGYLIFRSSINEGRLDMLDCRDTLLERELTDLERTPKGKIDHPIDGCLTSDTMILTNNGSKMIVDLDENNDLVASYNEVNDNVVYVNFTNLRKTRDTKEIYTVEFDDGTYVTCTGNHPFLLSSNEYVSADELSLGDQVKSSNCKLEMYNKYVIYVGVRMQVSEVPVYDIEVPSNHNFVLSNGAIVHNSKDQCLSYDTEIFLLSGKKITVEELYNDFNSNSDEWVLACDTENESLVPVKVDNVVKKDFVPEYMYKINLDNGKSFTVTNDHRILMRNSEYVKAEDLQVGDSLMPFNVYKGFRHKDYYRKEAIEKRKKTRLLNGATERLSRRTSSMNRDLEIARNQQLGKIKKQYDIVLKETNLFDDNDNVTREMYLNEIAKLKEAGMINKHFSDPSDYDSLIESGVPITNHTVISIEVIKNEGHHNVYDLQLSSIHNYALASGVFVHNCDSLSGAVWGASSYKLSNYYRYAMSDTQSATELNDVGSDALLDQTMGGAHLVDDLNQLARMSTGDGIINIFDE